MMGNERCGTLQSAAKDGFLVGADLLGLTYYAFSGDSHIQGYQAFSRLQRPLDAGQRAAEIAGIAAGITSNVVTLGLVNVMLLSEVYCKDTRTRDNKE